LDSKILKKKSGGLFKHADHLITILLKSMSALALIAAVCHHITLETVGVSSEFTWHTLSTTEVPRQTRYRSFVGVTDHTWIGSFTSLGETVVLPSQSAGSRGSISLLGAGGSALEYTVLTIDTGGVTIK